MIIFSGIVFVASLVLIAALFAFKLWEERRELVVARSWRERSDVQALRLKELIAALQVDATKLPPFLVYLGRVGLHEGALAFARLAQGASRQAHALADLVSHKRTFEPRETRSEFLKKVSEYKNGSSTDGHETSERVEF